MLYLTTVTEWTSHRDSKGRVGATNKPYGREFLINTDRITDLTAMDTQTTGGSFSKFGFTENPNSLKDTKDYLEVNASVAEIIVGRDTVPTSLFITLPVFINNNPARATVNTTIQVSDIVYADYDNNNHSHSWVLYVKDGFKKARVLVDFSLAEILDEISNPLLDLDGNVYTTVEIGSQEWTVQNLRTTMYADLSVIPYIAGDAAWVADVAGGYCYYNHDPAYGKAYGYLYNWYAVTNASGLVYFARNGVQEVGWRVPTVADYTTLSTALGGDNISGAAMKETGTQHWNYFGFIPGWPIDLPPANDAYGLRFLGSGNRFVDTDDNPGFDSLKQYDDKWTQDAHSATEGDAVYCSDISDNFEFWDHEKFGGMAVRCVRDI